MNKMINLRSAALLMFLAFLTMPVFAQSGGQGQRRQMSEQDIKERAAWMADTLNLTEKQEKEILEYDLVFYKTMQKERENFDFESGDRDAMRAKMMGLRDKKDAKYKEVLTAEQYGKYTKIVEGRRSQMRQNQEQSSDEDRSRGRGRGGN